jgi:hypothetical protein
MEDKDSQKLAALDERVDKIDSRLTRVETEMKDSRDENRRGFDDIKNQLNHLYAERAEWGKTARDIVRRVVVWLMWLIPALVGLRYAAEKIFTNN